MSDSESPYPGPSTFEGRTEIRAQRGGIEEDRRPLDVELERLMEAIGGLDDSLERLTDRLRPILSDRATPGMAREARLSEREDARSGVVQAIDGQRDRIEGLRERVETLLNRVDC